jgi:hypothetical protein
MHQLIAKKWWTGRCLSAICPSVERDCRSIFHAGLESWDSVAKHEKKKHFKLYNMHLSAFCSFLEKIAIRACSFFISLLPAVHNQFFLCDLFLHRPLWVLKIAHKFERKNVFADSFFWSVSYSFGAQMQAISHCCNQKKKLPPEYECV